MGMGFALGLSADVEGVELGVGCGKPVGSSVDVLSYGVGERQEEFMDVFGGAFGDESDGAVGLVADEAGDAQGLRDSECCRAEANALDFPCEDGIAAGVVHGMGADGTASELDAIGQRKKESKLIY